MAAPLAVILADTLRRIGFAVEVLRMTAPLAVILSTAKDLERAFVRQTRLT
jgi:hypothetical protein